MSRIALKPMLQYEVMPRLVQLSAGYASCVQYGMQVAMEALWCRSSARALFLRMSPCITVSHLDNDLDHVLAELNEAAFIRPAR